MPMKNPELKEILIVFSIAFLVSVSPVLARWYAYGIPGIIGFPTYYHQRIADYIISGTFSWYDPLSFGGRPYTYPPLFSFMLAGFSVLGLEFGGVIMMGLLGGLTAVTCFLLARELIGKKNAVTVILLSSPAFIFLFSHLSTRSPPILLGLIAIYLGLKKKSWWLISLPLAFSYFFHIETGLIFSALLMFVNRDYLNHAKSVLLALLAAGVFYAPLFMAYGIPQPNAIHTDYISRGYGLESFNLPYFAWETGNNYDNVALVVLAFSLIGFYFTKNSFLRKWFLLSLILALASTRLLMYLVFPAAILAAAGIYHASKKYRKYGKLILGIFFAYSIAIGFWMDISFATSYPVAKQTEALLWIKQNTPDNVTVLSDWAHGHWITGIAYRKSFVDGYAEYAPDADRRVAELKTFYKNCTVPQGYGIVYAYLEDWFLKSENITCLDRFQKVYDRDQIYVFKLSAD
ncbi:MAG: hypothetical protein NTY20_02200 [Candidatus Aenigmarchaeota archaeon]|nr:hypothetical protein [Candidatus Aenigmarchaeota archaeon]